MLSGHVPAATYLANLAQTTRDNARTPMQWSAAANAGFSTAKPWFAINPDYTHVNVAAQMGNQDSVLSFYRKMIRLRRAHPCLTQGAYHDLSAGHPSLYAYTQHHADGSALIMLNFSDTPETFKLPSGIRVGKLLIANMPPSQTLHSTE